MVTERTAPFDELTTLASDFVISQRDEGVSQGRLVNRGRREGEENHFRRKRGLHQATEGGWGHAEWANFVKTMQQNTQTWSEGTEAYLGGVLESLKAFYARAPTAAVVESVPVGSRKPSSKPSAVRKSRQPKKKTAPKR